MFKEKIIKTPFKSRQKFIKNYSCDSYDSNNNGEKIFKLSDRLFSSNTLSLLSKNNYNLSKNYINILKKHTLYQGDNNENTNYKFNSHDNHKYICFFSPFKNPKITYSTIEDTKNKKTKESFLSINNMKKLDRKKSQIFLPGVTSPYSIDEEENKRKFMQINKILKFNKIKKKVEIKKDLLPMQLGKDYIDFIEKKNKLKFNPNYNSPYIHKMNSNYMIDKNILNKLKFEKLKIKKQIEEEEK